MSIRWRLALWYGALSAALITVVCAYSFIVYRQSQFEELDAMLVSTAEHVANEVGAATSPGDLQHILDASLFLGAATRIYDADGHLRASDSASAAIPHADPRSVRALADGSGGRDDALATDVHRREPARGGFVTLGDSVHWRTYAVPLTRPSGILTTVLPLVHVEASVARFGWFMVVMMFVGSGAALFLGWLIAGYALRPVSVLSDAAAGIARSRAFGSRVPLGVRRDELGRLADTFNSMLGSLEAAYQAQQRFVSDASHELRAPLTAIQGNLDIALDPRAQSGEERDHALTEAASETRRMSRLVSNLLALARADAGITLRRDPVELDDVVMDVLGEARHLTAGQQLDIREIVPCVVVGDVDQLKQLLLILIDNAIRYTPAGGQIDVELQQRDASVTLVVRDTGIGISEEDLPHVFERFFRADRARTRDIDGTGLGLSIARWIADGHGATISIASERTKGTTVTLRFPVAHSVA